MFGLWLHAAIGKTLSRTESIGILIFPLSKPPVLILNFLVRGRNITHRGVNVGVTHKALDRPDVHAALVHIRRKGPAAPVRVDVLHLRPVADPVQVVFRGILCMPASVFLNEQSLIAIGS